VAPSLTRGRVCHFSSVLVFARSKHMHILHIIYISIQCLQFTVYNIYMASVSPGSVQKIMPYHTATAALSLERLYTWPPKSLSLLYLLCWALCTQAPCCLHTHGDGQRWCWYIPLFSRKYDTSRDVSSVAWTAVAVLQCFQCSWGD
jgi:hypothetical protein